jgi:hypothetical protein
LAPAASLLIFRLHLFLFVISLSLVALFDEPVQRPLLAPARVSLVPLPLAVVVEVAIRLAAGGQALLALFPLFILFLHVVLL